MSQDLFSTAASHREPWSSAPALSCSFHLPPGHWPNASGAKNQSHPALPVPRYRLLEVNFPFPSYLLLLISTCTYGRLRMAPGVSQGMFAMIRMVPVLSSNT